MPARQPKLPLLWLLSDARNDAALAGALARLPAGSGFVFRHYHLDPVTRAARFRELADIARAHGHLVLLADGAAVVREWGADGAYAGAGQSRATEGLLHLATAHDGAELAVAAKDRADGVFLSPVFATRSHPGTQPLGVHGFHVLAQQSPIPVIALGGMTAERARALDWPRWGAIDGLVPPHAP
jgi:thiamine-phosphate pyrophosphorylase